MLDDSRPDKKARPSLTARIHAHVAARLGPAAILIPIVGLALAWLYLSAFLNHPFPADAEGQPWLAFNPDVTILLAVLAAIAFVRPALPAYVSVLLTFAILPARILKSADAVMTTHFGRPFSLARDGALFFEGLMALDDTMSRGELVAWLAASGVGFGVALFLARQSFRVAEAAFFRLPLRAGFLGLAALVLVLGAATDAGLVSDAVTPRLAAVATDYGRRSDDREQLAQRATEVKSRVDLGGPPDKLERRDVFVFVLPGYADVTLEDPDVGASARRTLESMNDELGRAGYGVRSVFAELPSHGEMRFLTIAALDTGIPHRTASDLDFVGSVRRITLAEWLRHAGYRAIRVAPWITRERKEQETLGFGEHHYSWGLNYGGPKYGLSPMPDQYVYDVMRRRDVAHSDAPLFIQYELSSSVPPYSHVPRLVDDWRTLELGAAFVEQSPIEFPTELTSLRAAKTAYTTAIDYALRALGRYLSEVLPPLEDARKRKGRSGRSRKPSLVIALGADPPSLEVASASAPRRVPLHVLSRDPELLAPFSDVGFKDGLVPGPHDPSRPSLSVAEVFPLLVRAYSKDGGAAVAEEHGGAPH